VPIRAEEPADVSQKVDGLQFEGGPAFPIQPMRPASRAACCWRSSCARHTRSSLADADGLVEHPRTIKEIATASPAERKLIQYHTAFALRLKAHSELSPLAKFTFAP
jgi:hypothetical protein